MRKLANFTLNAKMAPLPSSPLNIKYLQIKPARQAKTVAATFFSQHPDLP
jgi:hypothetical protein